MPYYTELWHSLPYFTILYDSTPNCTLNNHSTPLQKPTKKQNTPFEQSHYLQGIKTQTGRQTMHNTRTAKRTQEVSNAVPILLLRN